VANFKDLSMKIQLICIGKNEQNWLIDSLSIYLKRIEKYRPIELIVLPDIKGKMNINQIKQKEAELLMPLLQNGGKSFLLDDKGKTYTSLEFAKMMETEMNQSTKLLQFVIGGAYGFNESIYQKVTHRISLSKLTFSHQMVRLILTEQIYRAFSILNNEPYHHE
jgi:23S rRNA (pseudouridine1915-N3)-methyltransferase